MNQQTVHPAYDPNRLLDALMERMGISSDKTLSRRLQIARNVIRDIRSGCRPIGASMLLRMSEHVGASIDELRCILGDQRAKFRLNCSLGMS